MLLTIHMEEKHVEEFNLKHLEVSKLNEKKIIFECIQLL
jgi:hypothetical protein